MRLLALTLLPVLLSGLTGCAGTDDAVRLELEAARTELVAVSQERDAAVRRAEAALATPAPEDWPVADPADVGSIEALMAALYDVISGPADEPRDWDRMRSLFHPGAGRLVPTGLRADGSLGLLALTPEDYIASASVSFAQQGFFEEELLRVEEHFGTVAHAMSSYATRQAADGPVVQRGVNSVQLVGDGTRWWVLSIAWCQESPERPLPGRYLP